MRDRWNAAGGDLDTFMVDWSRRSGTTDALTVDWKRLDNTHIEFDVTGCKYAEFWRGVGEPELGFLLQCSADFAVTDAVDPIHLAADPNPYAGRVALRLPLHARSLLNAQPG